MGRVVNSGEWESDPFITSDGWLLIFARGPRNSRMWMTRRATTDDPWSHPVELPATFKGTHDGSCPDISADGGTLYFISTHSAGYGDIDIWQAPIIPIVDLNGDGIVDSADMCIMVDHWGTDNSLCDIGPMPWGDGVVDVEDLKVLAEHLFEDYRLLAHWKLDEA